MDTFELLMTFGTVAFAVGFSYLTAARIWRSRTSAGVSSSMLTVTAVANTGWMVLAVTTGVPLLLVTSGLYVAGVAVALAGVVRAREDVHLAAAGVSAAALSIAYVAGGVDALAVTLLCVVVVRLTPQVVTVLRSSDLSGVSPSAWALAAFEGLLWAVYGAVAGVPSMLGWGVIALAASAVVLVRWRAWQGRAVVDVGPVVAAAAVAVD